MKKTTIIAFIAFLFVGSAVNAQITLNNTQTPAQLVNNVLIGAGVTPTNIKFNTSAASANLVRDQAARFNINFTPGNLGFPSNSTGVILSTGKATVALGPNDSTSLSDPPAVPVTGDPDLALLCGQTVRNVSVLEFDFVATGLVLNFDYVFGSEEYPEFVNSSFNDTFGFFLSGPGIVGPYSGSATNIALVPSTAIPITINNVNNGFNNDGTCSNCLYYHNNSNIGVNPETATGPTVQYDGFTTVLRATSPLECGGTYHIKLAVGNVSDNAYDSAVFLKNFEIEPLVLIDNYNLSDNPNVCFGETITIYSGLTVGTNIFEWTHNGTIIPGENGPTLTVTLPGTYGLTVFTAAMCQIAEDEIIIDYLPEIPILPPLDLNLCTALPPPHIFNIDQTAYVLNGLDPNLFIVSYYNTSYNDALAGGAAGTIPNATLGNYVVGAVPASVWIRVEDILTACVVVQEFILDTGAPSGTISYPSLPYCDDLTTPQPVTETALTDGGTYAAVPNTLIIDPITGAVTPFGSPVGIYTVTYEIAATAFCPLYQTTTTVEIIDCGSCTVISSSTSETVCIGSAIPSMTYTVTGGATGAAISAGALPGGVSGTLAAGVYTLSGTPTGVGVYNFTVSLNSGPIDVCTVNVTITVIAVPNAGTDGNTTVCESSAAAINLFSLITGEQAGGTWSQTVGSGGTFNAAAGTFTPAIGAAATNTFTYTVPGVAPCPSDSSLASVNISAQPTAGTDGGINICGSSATPIDLFSLITGEQAGGSWIRNTGSGGTFNAGTGTFTPGVGATTSEFQYTVPGAAPCPSDSSLATVTISAQLDAGTDGGISVCESSVAAINLFSLITGEQGGGTWSQTTGSGGTFNAAAGTFTPAVGAATSSFTYTLTGTLPCIDDTSVATVTIVAQPVAGTDGTATVCDSSSAAVDLFSLITGEQSGGAWTRTTGIGGVFNAAAGTFTPAPGATDSAFIYTLTGTAPCINDTSTATVNINPQPSAGADGAVTVCDSSVAAITLSNLITGEQPGGVWTRTSGAGGIFNAAAGTFTPAAGSTTSTFEYTVAGTLPCINDTSIATVGINAQPNAGTDGTATVCESSASAINLLSLITGEQPGGTWTRNTGTGGSFDALAGTFTPAVGATGSTFTYTLTGTAPCINDTSTATININPQPTAGVDANTVVCDSSTAAIDLFSLITGEQSGGVWTRTTGTGGTFNAAAGTFTPAPGATGSTFTYTVAATAPCVDDTSLATITINAQPDAGADGNITVCDADGTSINLSSLISGEQTGGTWVRTTGTDGTFNAAAGTYTPVRGATTSAFTYTILGGVGCIDDSSVATVNIIAQPDAGSDGSVTVCDSNIAPIDLFALIGGEQSAGTWTRATGTGGAFNAAAGTFTPAPGAVSSTFEYTLVAVSPCTDDVSIATVNINAQPDAGAPGLTTVCDSSTSPVVLSGLITGEQSGGVWTRATGTGGVFNATAGTFTPSPGATTSTFNYTIAGAAPCIDDASVATVNINAQPNAGADGNTSVCQTGTAPIDLFSLIGGEQPGGAWTRTTGTGGIFNAAAGTFTPSAGVITSTFTYTIPGIAPCIDDVSLATVNINLQPDAGTDGAVTVCESSTAAISLSGLITGEQAGGVWTRTSGSGGVFSAAAGTFTPAVGASNSTFAYTLSAAVPCINDTSVATVNVLPQPDAGADGSIAVCESSATAINLFTLISGEQSGGTWTRTSGTGGTFNAVAGTFIPAAGATNSTFTYAIAGIAPCISDSSLATVTVTPQPDAGADGNASVCDSSAAAINLFTLITGEQSGGTWTRTSGTGGVFNAGAGTFTPGPGATTSTFTYTLTGIAPCVNDTSVATVNINAQPEAGANGQVTVCSLSTAVIDLFGLISAEQPGGTWTRTSGTGGSFNAAAGTFTPALGALTSTFTYTITGAAPCINDSSIATVTITPAVLPVFAPVAAICLGDFLGALPTTSSNGITGTWTPALDNTATTTYTFLPDGAQCAKTTTMTIIVNKLPGVTLPQDGYICLDNNGNPSTTFLLTTGLGAGYSFVWSGPAGPVGTNSGSYLATEPGNYSVVVTNTVTGCVSSAQATIITSYPPQVVTAIASDYFSEQQIVTVSVFPAGNYEYQLDGGAFQDSNEFINVPAGEHTVHVRDKVGCGTAEDDFIIIDYPKFFTPNSDGYNDTWNIFALRGQANTKIYIFDRYGKLLKEISPNGNGWDGNLNGKPLPGTDYWFIVHYDEENVGKVFKAHFALKR